MKRLKVLMILAIFACCYAQAYYSICHSINGRWTEWRSNEFDYRWKVRIGNDIIIYSDRPYDYSFRCYITSDYYKEDGWKVYDAQIEYYTCSDYPTMESQLRGYGYPFVNNHKLWNGSKRVVKGKLKVKGKLFKTYNIFFDGVGIALSES